MAEKGRGIFMVYVDIDAPQVQEFNEWYNKEHLPELLSVPGILSAARYEAVSRRSQVVRLRGLLPHSGQRREPTARSPERLVRGLWGYASTPKRLLWCSRDLYRAASASPL